MASVESKDIPEIKDFMAAFWQLVKRYWIPEPDNDEYWEGWLRESSEMYKKYDDPFARGMLMEFGDYLDKKAERIRKEKTA